jgi:TonB family protein
MSRIVVVAIVVLSSVVLTAQEPQSNAAPSPELAATLALPISPGSIALLAEHPTEAAAQQRLQQVLKDDRPPVRRVAARVILNAGLRMLLADLRSALKAEQDPGAGAEELRALMTFAPALAPECVEAAVRLRGGAVTELVDMFARLNSADLLLTHLATLEQAQARPAVLQEALKTLIESDPTLRDRLLRDFASDPIAIEAALIAWRAGDSQVSDDLLIPLLKSTSDQVRLVTAWQLARAITAEGFTVSPTLNRAIDPLLAANETQVTWEGFAVELLERAARQKGHERHWTALTDAQAPQRFANRGFHADERRMLERWLSETELREIDEVLHAPHLTPMKPGPPSSALTFRDHLIVRTVPRLTSGLVGEVLRLKKCEPKEGLAAFANITYRADGRPRQLFSPPNPSLSDGCQQAARVLFALAVAREAKPIADTYGEALMLPLESTRIACLDEPMPVDGDSTAARVGPGPRQVKAPERIKNVNPNYPKDAQRDGVQGTVVIESTITATGCVINGRTISSPDVRLSSAALFAVMGWHYTPVLVDEKPVPVIMTVTVNFSLRP